ncbi:putative toxin-antitoxin system toxin component, PIN family [Thermococcus sp. 21S7]|uniref:putative toxin-antitoxin system toxin component, PIN family n=1 Tax=Thermococcus sp. 21S7 TaxID=1638221 RepID=UPI00143A1FC3|nr:putative toxin-antitoxin system toxin component, PIN family [Thermococcus sp. 21S7]NJE60969.1 putative toxin-antitoxin system toxin component, PIN family [Thermococcus sp. 21S7]
MPKPTTVIDTSVLVSALKSKNETRSPAWKILGMLKAREIENNVTIGILNEIEITLFSIVMEFSTPETYWDLIGKAHEILRIIRSNSRNIEPKHSLQDKRTVEKLQDPNDVKFLEAVFASKAKYLITENTKHFGNFVMNEGAKTGRAKILNHYFYIFTAREFVRELQKKK